MRNLAIVFIVTLFLSFSVYSYDNQELSRISASFSNIKKSEDKQVALKYAKHSVNRLDGYSIKQIKNYERYGTLGSIYMYYGFLIKNEKDVDETIRVFTRALEIRNDPNSHKELATSYKKKYNDAVLDRDRKKEKYYGEKIYYHLNKYIVIAKIEDNFWQKRRDYFEIYIPKRSLAKYKKQNNKKM